MSSESSSKFTKRDKIAYGMAQWDYSRINKALPNSIKMGRLGVVEVNGHCLMVVTLRNDGKPLSKGRKIMFDRLTSGMINIEGAEKALDLMERGDIVNAKQALQAMVDDYGRRTFTALVLRGPMNQPERVELARCGGWFKFGVDGWDDVEQLIQGWSSGAQSNDYTHLKRMVLYLMKLDENRQCTDEVPDVNNDPDQESLFGWLSRKVRGIL